MNDVKPADTSQLSPLKEVKTPSKAGSEEDSEYALDVHSLISVDDGSKIGQPGESPFAVESPVNEP